MVQAPAIGLLIGVAIGGLALASGPASAPDGALGSRADRGDLSSGLVAFSVGDLPESRPLVVSRLDGSGRRLLTPPARRGESRWDEEPEWSPDGTKIAFTRTRGVIGRGRQHETAAVYVAERTGGVVTRVSPPTSSDAIWSADGAMLAFGRSERCESSRSAGSGIYVVNPDGSSPRRVVSVSSRVRRNQKLRSLFLAQDWSPDGESLLYLEGTWDCGSDQIRESLYRVGIDDGKPRLLVSGTTNVSAFGPLSEGTFFGEAAWSPDGRLIAYTHACDAGPGGDIYCDLFVMNADGSRRRTLERDIWDVEVTWADGDTVFFTKGCCTRPNTLDGPLQTVSVTTGRAATVARNLPFAQDLALSLDGTRVALVFCCRKRSECSPRVAVVNLETGRTTRGRCLPSLDRPYSFHLP